MQASSTTLKLGMFGVALLSLATLVALPACSSSETSSPVDASADAAVVEKVVDNCGGICAAKYDCTVTVNDGTQATVLDIQQEVDGSCIIKDTGKLTCDGKLTAEDDSAVGTWTYKRERLSFEVDTGQQQLHYDCSKN